jgi:hypothetical protein
MLNNWFEYKYDYQEAANLLLSNAIKTKKRNSMVFPMIFLYRHYIELSLKEIILNTWEFLGINSPFPQGHKIDKLWETCRDCLQKADKLVDPTFAKSPEYRKQIVQEYENLEKDLQKFSEIDPDSEHFRYPVDNHGNPINIDNEKLIELLKELPELTKRISYNLDGLSVGISQIIQDKYEALAEQEHYRYE